MHPQAPKAYPSGNSPHLHGQVREFLVLRAGGTSNWVPLWKTSTFHKNTGRKKAKRHLSHHSRHSPMTPCLYLLCIAHGTKVGFGFSHPKSLARQPSCAAVLAFSAWLWRSSCPRRFSCARKGSWGVDPNSSI